MRLGLAVALGSGVGGLLRYGVALALRDQLPAGLPLATLGVNLLGSTVFGILAARQGHTPLGEPLFLALTTGLLGGFTTYSSFNGELLRMLADGHVLRALGYGLTTATTCLAGGGLGWWLGTAR